MRFPHTSEVRRERDTVVKVLPRDVSAIAAMRERWEAACPELERFRHPGFVEVLAHAARADGRLTVTLRAVEGAEDLRTRVARDGPLSPREASDALAPVAAAIDALHDAGLIYADAKTGNVLMTPNGPLLAHSWLTFPRDDAEPERFLDPDRFAGTIDYAAPEVIEGELPTLRSDVYGLGCALFECVTARVPFPRETEDLTLDAHLHESPPATERPALDAIIARAMAKEPRARFQTAVALIAAVP